MNSRILFIVFLLSSYYTSSAQGYIVFEKHTGLNKMRLLSGMYLLQNDISLASKDTALYIFNLYYTTDTLETSGLDKDALNKSREDISRLRNDILITAVPLVKPGEKLQLEPLDKKEFDELKIETNEELLKKAVQALYPNLTTDNYTQPSLKSFGYKLIIKEGNKYFKVEQPVFVEYNAVFNAFWYFPNQFKNGALNIVGPPFTRIYNKTDFMQIPSVFYTYAYNIYNEIGGRTYVSKIDTSYSSNPVFHFWKQPKPYPQLFDIDKSYIPPQFAGLLNFQFLEKIGIINCRLDFFLKEEFKLNMGDCCVNESETFHITSINSLDPIAFRQAYKNYIRTNTPGWYGPH